MKDYMVCPECGGLMEKSKYSDTWVCTSCHTTVQST